MRDRLLKQAEGYSPTPRAFLDRLVEADDARRRGPGESLSIEGLQRETNRLLRLNLIEQQIQARAGEFEGRAFVRPISGGVPGADARRPARVPPDGRRLAATRSAQEWARASSKAFRTRVFNEDDVRKIDLATDRPDRVNPPDGRRYVEAMPGPRPRGDGVVRRPRRSTAGDANACIAAFVLARQAPEGPRLRWVRQVLAGLPEFPDAALATLRGLEAEARAAESEAAPRPGPIRHRPGRGRGRPHRRRGPHAPATSNALARLEARPLARPGEAIGLNLDRRGPLDAGRVRRVPRATWIDPLTVPLSPRPVRKPSSSATLWDSGDYVKSEPKSL